MDHDDWDFDILGLEDNGTAMTFLSDDVMSDVQAQTHAKKSCVSNTDESSETICASNTNTNFWDIPSPNKKNDKWDEDEWKHNLKYMRKNLSMFFDFVVYLIKVMILFAWKYSRSIVLFSIGLIANKDFNTDEMSFEKNRIDGDKNNFIEIIGSVTENLNLFNKNVSQPKPKRIVRKHIFHDIDTEESVTDTDTSTESFSDADTDSNIDIVSDTDSIDITPRVKTKFRSKSKIRPKRTINKNIGKIGLGSKLHNGARFTQPKTMSKPKPKSKVKFVKYDIGKSSKKTKELNAKIFKKASKKKSKRGSGHRQGQVPVSQGTTDVMNEIYGVTNL